MLIKSDRLTDFSLTLVSLNAPYRCDNSWKIHHSLTLRLIIQCALYCASYGTKYFSSSIITFDFSFKGIFICWILTRLSFIVHLSNKTVHSPPAPIRISQRRLHARIVMSVSVQTQRRDLKWRTASALTSAGSFCCVKTVKIGLLTELNGLYWVHWRQGRVTLQLLQPPWQLFETSEGNMGIMSK